MVATNLSKKGLTEAKSKKREKTKAAKHATNGGKRKTFFIKKEKSNFSVFPEEAFNMVITPTEEKSTKVTWSKTTAL